MKCINSGISPEKLEALLRINKCITRLAARKFEGEITRYFSCLDVHEYNQSHKPYFVWTIHKERSICLKEFRKVTQCSYEQNFKNLARASSSLTPKPGISIRHAQFLYAEILG